MKILKLAAIIVVLSQSAQSSEIELQQTTYQQALDFRDCKVAGYSEEESKDKAAELFLECAQSGDPKAMHNYAMIAYNKTNYELAYEWFAKAGLDASKRNCERMLQEGKVKQPLYLVVGSSRISKLNLGPVINAIYGQNNADMSHRNTFAGKATTCDMQKSDENSAPHIVCDATQFNFSAKYNVKRVLLERFPTLDDNLDCYGVSNSRVLHLFSNYTGKCINNIAKAMTQGAKLEIEWLPYTSLISDDEDLEQLISKNPFNGFFNINVVLQSIFIMGGDKDNINILPQHLIPLTTAMTEKAKEYLTFYHSQGAGQSINELIDLVYSEAGILLQMIINKSMVLLDYDLFNENNKNLVVAKKTAVYGKFPDNLIGKRIEIKDNNGNYLSGVVYNDSSFQTKTLLNFLIQDIAAEHNASKVKEYIKSAGFSDVSIEKTTNPHTGRKNVWMINAVKSWLCLFED